MRTVWLVGAFVSLLFLSTPPANASCESLIHSEEFQPNLERDFKNPDFSGFFSNMRKIFEKSTVDLTMLEVDLKIAGVPQKMKYEQIIKQFPQFKERLDSVESLLYRQAQYRIGYTLWYRVSDHTRLVSEEIAVKAYQAALKIQKADETASEVLLSQLLKNPTDHELYLRYRASVEKAVCSRWVAEAYFPTVNGLESRYLHIVDGKIQDNPNYDPRKDTKRNAELETLSTLITIASIRDGTYR